MAVRACRAALLIVILGGVPSAARAGAMLSTALSNQELSAVVTDAYIAFGRHDLAAGNRDPVTATDAGRRGAFSGIETVSINRGHASVTQAATAVSVRAALTLGADFGRAANSLK